MLHFDQQLLTNLSQTLKLCLILSTGANPLKQCLCVNRFINIQLLVERYLYNPEHQDQNIDSNHCLSGAQYTKTQVVPHLF